MLDRVWWFFTGVIAGGLVTIRALRRKPTAAEYRHAAIVTGADVLNVAANAIRPKRSR